MYEAFAGIAQQHGFPPDLPKPEIATYFMMSMIAAPSYWSRLAEVDGKIVGSVFLSESDSIRGVGPITIDPASQGQGVGRRLMEAVVERGQGAPGLRLMQDSFNMRSLSLYASLGFEVKEPTVVVRGKLKSSPLPGWTVRPMQPTDFEECAELCEEVHGFDRLQELGHIAPPALPYVALRDGRITAYASAPNFWIMGHGVAESEEDMRALLLGFSAAQEDPVSILLPIRQASFFRWCLAEGLRAIKPMNLMAIGEYNEPDGCWFPSVVY